MARLKKLFEYIVSRDQLKGQLRALATELRGTFEKKRHLFEERRKTFTANTEGAQPVVEEQQDIQSTVMDELKWFGGHWIKTVDSIRQVEEGNITARADILLDDGMALVTGLPATALLDLSNRTDELLELLKSVPTLDPAKAFAADEARGNGIFKARDVTKARTKKIEDIVVVVQPTKEHPAQIAKLTKDVETGTILEQEWSGMITPAMKADMLSRVEEVRRAVKSALQRANAVELPTEPVVGAKLYSYVLGVSVGADANAGARS